MYMIYYIDFPKKKMLLSKNCAFSQFEFTILVMKDKIGHNIPKAAPAAQVTFVDNKMIDQGRGM